MLQVTAVGMRRGCSAAVSTLGEGSVALESRGDSDATGPSPESPLRLESLGDSESSVAPADGDGMPEVGFAVGETPPPLLLDPPVGPSLGVGLGLGPAVPDGCVVALPPPVGLAVGEEVGDGEAVGVDAGLTGGATPGGTMVPAVRSCCHDQPTDPPEGTVSAPTP